MEAWITAKPSKPSARRRFTASPSPGLPFEDYAARIAEARGLKVLARNFRVHRLEGDLLLKQGERLLLWEVRGRSRPGFRPSLTISPKKLNYLKRLAASIAQSSHRTVKLQLIEIIGLPPRSQVRIFDIDPF